METLTYSRIKMRKNCPCAEHFRYDLGLTLRYKKQALQLGSAVHKGLETGDINKALAEFDNIFPLHQDEQDKLDITKATCKAMLNGYRNKWDFFGDDTIKEYEFILPIINPKTKAKSRSFYLAGKIDAITQIDDQYWLVEYKTASQINSDYFYRLDLDEQISLYMYAAKRALKINPVGIIYRVIRKPSIRPKKNESINQYCYRLERDYIERNDFYFFEGRFYRDDTAVKDFERELWEFTKQKLYDTHHNIHYKNPSRCLDYGVCEYFPLCTKQPDAEALFEKKAPHEELTQAI